MSQHHLTDALVKRLAAPSKGNRITYDDAVKGFGVRVTVGEARSFILNYRTRSGRERRYTIGAFPDWQVTAARQEAAEWKRRIDQGADPLAELEAGREAPTVADLCQRFEEEHLQKLRPTTAHEYKAIVASYILPAMRHLKVADVTFSHVDALHRQITKRGAAYRANRAVGVLSKMFSLAIRWKWRPDNPVKGIERNQEVKRHRYLSGEELARLTVALAAHEDPQAANIIRLLLLTGARRSEGRAATWDQFDLDAGVWTKPGATTKQKTEHRVPLSAPARQLLTELREKARADAKFVFPGKGVTGHRLDLQQDWKALCAAAGIAGARLHDLRHTYASVLVSAGLSLPIVGALLGHTLPATTARYAHLADDPLRVATERAGAIITRKPSAEIVPIKDAG